MRLLLVVGLLVSSSTSFSQELCKSIERFGQLEKSKLYKFTPDTIGPIGQKEISGIAPSIKYPGHFWGIADSGNGSVLYLYSLANAEIRSAFILNDIKNIDWEDLSLGIDRNGNGVLYIPDIGDNRGQRKHYFVYVIPESKLVESDKKVQKIYVDPQTIRFTYSNGPRDCEAMVYDPSEKRFFVFSKREKKISFFALENKPSKEIQVLVPQGNLPISNVVGADFSPDGMKLLIKTYTNIYLWTREYHDEPICSMLSRKPLEVPYQLEPQGESLCFVQDGFITVSEERFGIKPALYFYPKSR